ncbi:MULTISPECIES: hypothetical protein [unclassified Oscillibacter]|uniref:hypothetical protein n=1 Tax=unclassified Oscillibacter TaxID=2629304 RepID=UPI0025D6EEFC|nr:MULTISPECIES: hypothetical protein [unclassified Oscillibacter]
MIRVTTNGTLRGYRTSLTRSSATLDNARNKVLTQSNYTSYAEDPAAATQAFKLRRSFSRVSSQLQSTQSLNSKFSAACDALSSIKSDLADGQAKISALAGLNDANASGRQPLGEVIGSAAESIVQILNSQYGSSFIFGGKDSLGEAPFKMEEINGENVLIYRGVRVDAEEGTDEYEQLKAMAGEESYVDIGSGLTEVDGKLVSTSAFNGALSGLNFVGYGVDDDGDPKNMASVMNKLSEIFKRCDADTGAWASDQDKEDATRLTEKLKDGIDEITNQWTALDGRTTYLETSSNRLSLLSTNLNEQILGIEQIDLANAITDFSWAQYCYNAALKVGNGILSQSLIDYMN